MNDTIERSQTHATFVIERTYPAPVEAVWHALSDNDARDQWFSAGQAFAGGGTLLRQVIKLGLLDELELHIVPVILGNGMRLLGPELGLDSKEGIELAPARVITTADVTHIRYQVNGRRPLILDNRGRDEEPPSPRQRT